jgi:hypothetical protein
VNKAKSLTEMYKQASLVVPIALPSSLPARVRDSLSVDASSPWHTAALLSAAVESATLPSRLRDPANRETLGHMADRLNVHGRQTVANLQMSFAGAGAGPPRSTAAGDEPKDGLRLDMDFRPADDLLGGGATRRQQDGSRPAPKIFSQILASRGERDGGGGDGVEDQDMQDDEDDRTRRGARGDAVSRRYRSGLGYPLLDSFPQIFRDAKGEALRDSSIAVTTSLSTDAELSGRLRSLRATVTRLIGLEDREELSNELAEMADEYHEGWSSGSDSGEDD